MTTEVVESPPVPRLKERYRSEIAPALREEFGYPNVSG
jgi:large subunit ribosomal protein L5